MSGRSGVELFMSIPEVEKVPEPGSRYAPASRDDHPTIPSAHEDTVASMKCAERNTHIDCTGWLQGTYGLLICGCWCHHLGEES